MTCPECSGTGLVFNMQHTDSDMCHRCEGYGEIEQPCGNEKLTREELNAPAQDSHHPI